MPRVARLSRAIWVSIWVVAVLVTLIGGNWHVPTSVPANWKLDIQFPGIVVVLYAGWLLGPLQTIMSPPVVCILTILTNVLVYYFLARMALVFRALMKKGS
jgi:hypothetical protein